MPAVDLRELVKTPIELTGTFAEPKNPHPVHAGIYSSRRYTSNAGSPIELPHRGRGLERLKVSIHDPVSGLNPEASLESHVKLLAAAPFFQTLPGTAVRGPEGESLPEDDAARTRAVLFAGVFRDPDEKFVDHSFSSPRLAGVGMLTVLPSLDDPRYAEDAWLSVEWVRSSRAMLSALLSVPGLLLEPPAVNRRIEILIAEGIAAERESLPEDVARIAMMLGGSPQIHVVVDAEWGKSASKVRANNPFELVVLGSTVHEGVVAEFTRRHGERDLHRADVTSADGAVGWLLDSLPHIMGVAPGLMSFPQAEIVAGRPRMPVKRPEKCLHHGTNKYVLDAATNEWWTRDFAQHGTTDPTVFKTYAMIDGDLSWRTDRDAGGDVIVNKHKGPEGDHIHVRETGSCAYPASHLH